MDEQVEFFSGPIAGRKRPLAGMSEVVAVPVDAGLDYLPQGTTSSAVALYRRQTDKQGVSYHFLRFERSNKQPFEAEFADGPNQGTHPCSQPPHFHTKELLAPLTENGEVFKGDGEPSAVAVYTSKLTAGKWRFHLDRIEESGVNVEEARAQINARRAIQATNSFYLSPNYSIYSKPPTGEHPQVFIELGHRRAYVDEGIAPLVLAIWEWGLETLGSCQERPSGKAYVGFPLARQGKLFHKKLTEAAVKSECMAKKLRLQKSDSGQVVEVDSANVLFSPADIPRITMFVRSQTR